MLKTMQQLCLHLTACTPAARAVTAHLALRAALHPLLRPYLQDPLLPLNDRFPSVDAQVAGIVEYAESQRCLHAAINRLPFSDQALLSALTPDSFESEDHVPIDEEVGAVWGALYVPSKGEAVPCRVFAAAIPGAADDGTGWPEPMPVRPCSPEIRQSARDALAAALHAIEVHSQLSVAPWPSPLLFDICVPELDEESVGRVAGDSLGLPLALAFLSALLNAPVPSPVGATGAVGRQRHMPEAIDDVGWVPDKAAALVDVAQTLIVPAASGATEAGCKPLLKPVESVPSAARAAGPALAALFAELPAIHEVAPPRGTVTFLAATIMEAAALWERVPLAMREAVEHQDSLTRRVLTRHGGYILQTINDEIDAAFPDASSACAAALAVQQAMQSHPWPAPIGSLRVRIGIHTGNPDFFRGDYYGPTLHQTRRLAAAAHGGQTLLTEAAYAALQDEADPGWDIRPVGRHRLHDLTEPLDLHQLSRPPLPDSFAPVRTLETLRHNLPIQGTSLVGREAEVAMLAGLLRQGGSRLATLIGPGGVGKTRLSLQVAAEMLTAYPEGVWFVSLAEARTTEDVATFIADTLGLSVSTDPTAQLKEALHPKRILLVLDNFENVLCGATLVADLLASAPGLTCLATSRAPLHIREEKRFPVEPLPMPLPGALPEEIRAAPAVALFCDRARAARPDWSLADEDAQRTLDICRRVDGLPLAIELAAARMAVLSLAELHTRIKKALPLLVTRQRDLPERHRTLAKTLEWSYDLLEQEQQRLFAWLSVFAGSFSLEAVEALVEGDETLDHLHYLVDSSLVASSAGDEHNRFRLLVTIREFVSEKLERSGEGEAARAAHARYFDRWARQHAGADLTDQELEAFDALEAQMENIRAACAWLKQNNPVVFAGLVNSLAPFIRRRGHWGERQTWLEAAIAAVPHERALQAQLRFHLGRSYMDQGNFNEASDFAREATDISRSLGMEKLTADAIQLQGLIAAHAHRTEEAYAFHREALEHYRAAGDTRAVGKMLSSLGVAAWHASDMVAARGYLEEAIEVLRTTGDVRELSIAVNNMALVHDSEGDYAGAERLMREYLMLSRECKIYECVAIAIANLGELRARQGDLESGVVLLAAGERLLGDLGHGYRHVPPQLLSELSPAYGETRLQLLRQDLARRPTEYLQQIDSLLPAPAAAPTETD